MYKNAMRGPQFAGRSSLHTLTDTDSDSSMNAISKEHNFLYIFIVFVLYRKKNFILVGI